MFPFPPFWCLIDLINFPIPNTLGLIEKPSEVRDPKPPFDCYNFPFPLTFK